MVDPRPSPPWAPARAQGGGHPHALFQLRKENAMTQCYVLPCSTDFLRAPRLNQFSGSATKSTSIVLASPSSSYGPWISDGQWCALGRLGQEKQPALFAASPLCSQSVTAESTFHSLGHQRPMPFVEGAGQRYLYKCCHETGYER
jgi:hypothetical protein